MNETNDKNENHKGEKTLEQFIEEKLSSKGSKNVEEGTNENKLKKMVILVFVYSCRCNYIHVFS